VEELEKVISKANGNVEVKIKGYTELSPIEMVTMDNGKHTELMENLDKMNLSTGLKINRHLQENLKQSLKDINRTPKKIFEDRQRGLFLALDNDDKLWILEKSWIEIKEPSYPDLPKKEIE